MALGAQLREARMRMGMTESEVAAATRMKIQIVEAIEREDFTAVAAPIYGKGFIKLFAERVGLDPKPLVEEYVATFVQHKARILKKNQELPVRVAVEMIGAETAEEKPEDDLFDRVDTAHEEGAGITGPAEQKSQFIRTIVSAFSRLRECCMLAAQRTRTAIEEKGVQFREGTSVARIDLKNIRFSEAPLKTLGIAAGILVILVFLFSALSRYVTRPRAGSPSSDGELQLALDPPDPYLE